MSIFKEFYNKLLAIKKIVLQNFVGSPRNRVSVFFCMVSVFSHYINIIGIGQKLMCPIQFQSFLVLLNLPDGTFQSKVEKQW
jgi:hypothetical protein